MTNVSLISYPELNQDTINQVAQCRASLIAIFRELRKNDHSEIELGPSLPINMLNRTLFDLIKQMLGKDKEHVAIVQSFLNCNRLMLDEIADMSYCEFNLYCCNHFVGFKSKMTPEEVFSALDGEIRPVGTDLCHEEKFRFIQAYWLEIWRYVRSNYLHTKFCTQLDLDILNKLSVSSADQLARFLLDDRQTFELTFDIEKILEFRKAISSPPPPKFR